MPAYINRPQTFRKSKACLGLDARHFIMVFAFLLAAVSPASAQQTCVTTLCLEGLTQTPPWVIKGGPQCQAALCEFFSVRIYDHSGYDAPSTAATRWPAFLAACPDQTAALAMWRTWGTVFSIPGCV